MHADAFILLQAVDLGFAYVIFFMQRIFCDLFFFHCFPQFIVPNHVPAPFLLPQILGIFFIINLHQKVTKDLFSEPLTKPDIAV